MRYAPIVAATLLLAIASLPAIAAEPYLEDEPAMAALHWITGSTTLLKSHAELSIPAGTRALAGRDVDAYDAAEGPATADDADEGVLRFFHRGTVTYSFCACGHSTDAGWDAFDAQKTARTLAAADAGGGSGNERFVGWAHAPSLDRATHALTWEAHIVRTGDDGARHDANQALALVFTRFGHEIVIADTRRGDAASTWNELRIALASLRFTEGTRYEDARSGDASAGTMLEAFLSTVRADP